MGKPQVEEQEDIFQAILLADNFGLSIFGSEWAERQNPGANKFLDDDGDEEIESKASSEEKEIGSKLTQEVSFLLIQNRNAPFFLLYNWCIKCQKFFLQSLMPLGNRKLIDYNLEALTVSGVQEIYIFCSSGVKGGEALKAHIKQVIRHLRY